MADKYGLTRGVPSMAPKKEDMHKCPSCTKTVYFAERVQGLDDSWYHKGCFRCAECKTSLQPGGYTDHENKLYCKRCHTGVSGVAGYGSALTSLTPRKYGEEEARSEIITESNILPQ
eukprot:TRINITY_DN26992_c0_g1_i1.p2 TRINITY_DN26992_c0_g1~~TRINITY_DN26992_c0_g1_i1.p2  ORF type:complete len:117 (-),score=7.19 TRINITY_DN26992_c0_g1_i1:179-529(-)